MSSWMVFGIIALVLGIIIGNIMFLRETRNFKSPKAKLPPGVKPQPYEDDDD